MTTQREKDIEHFIQTTATGLERGGMSVYGHAAILADGAEYGRKDLARRLFETLNAPGDPVDKLHNARRVLAAILQGDG